MFVAFVRHCSVSRHEVDEVLPSSPSRNASQSTRLVAVTSSAHLQLIVIRKQTRGIYWTVEEAAV